VIANWWFGVSQSYYPALGDASIYTEGTELITVTNALLQTGTTLNVKLTQCLTQAQWQNLVMTTLGLTSTSQVSIRPLGSNANCNQPGKRAKRDAAAATFSSFQTDLFSTDIHTSGALAAQLQAEGAAIGIQSSEVVAFTPTTASAATGVLATAPVAPGGGGGGGFSDGAIAGIVVGSTVGGSLIILSVLGIAGLVAYKVFKSDDKYSQETKKSGSSVDKAPSHGRRTLFFFKNKDAVDVHQMETKDGHQSITARAPPLEHAV